MSAPDPYADWDAAYVLGSLSPLERREFEQHLAECDSCAAAVAELAGLPGLLAKVPTEEAVALPSAGSAIPVPDTLLPRLIRSASRRRRRTRGLVAGVIVASTAAAAAVALAIPLVFPVGQPEAKPTAQVTLSQVVQSPITASVKLSTVKWGTRIDMDCTYAASPSAGWDDLTAGASHNYAMYVTDAAGQSTEVASWTATPGTTVEPSGTTSLAIDQIAAVEVRTTNGTVLLSGTPKL
jgi:hypothetical protein